MGRGKRAYPPAFASGGIRSQVVLDAARLNALEEHATVLAYMKHDMAEGVAEIVFGDTEIFHHGFPDTVKNLSELLAQPEYLSEINERLEGAALAYAEDKDIMRFHFYRPDKVSAQFKKICKRGSAIWRKRRICMGGTSAVYYTG